MTEHKKVCHEESETITDNENRESREKCTNCNFIAKEKQHLNTHISMEIPRQTMGAI